MHKKTLFKMGQRLFVLDTPILTTTLILVEVVKIEDLLDSHIYTLKRIPRYSHMGSREKPLRMTESSIVKSLTMHAEILRGLSWTSDHRLLKPLGELNFSTRAKNCFESENINNLGDLVQWTHEDMLKVPNMGPGCLKGVLEVLKQIGFSLGMSTEDVFNELNSNTQRES